MSIEHVIQQLLQLINQSVCLITLLILTLLHAGNITVRGKGWYKDIAFSIEWSWGMICLNGTAMALFVCHHCISVFKIYHFHTCWFHDILSYQKKTSRFIARSQWHRRRIMRYCKWYYTRNVFTIVLLLCVSLGVSFPCSHGQSVKHVWMPMVSGPQIRLRRSWSMVGPGVNYNLGDHRGRWKKQMFESWFRYNMPPEYQNLIWRRASYTIITV